MKYFCSCLLGFCCVFLSLLFFLFHTVPASKPSTDKATGLLYLVYILKVPAYIYNMLSYTYQVFNCMGFFSIKHSLLAYSVVPLGTKNKIVLEIVGFCHFHLCMSLHSIIIVYINCFILHRVKGTRM